MPPRKSKTEVKEIPAEVEEVASEAPEVVEVVAAPVRRASRNEIAIEPKMKFSTWFMVKSADDPRLKTHHMETLRAYMSSQGLSAEEPARRYDAALRAYFGT